ncbi:MAG: outer membrane beta-barrel protein [Candidatus Aminicenantes bacterium]|nr:outer membrane beta-barrel protein [Candidatus Aminicenantes bacterium]
MHRFKAAIIVLALSVLGLTVPAAAQGGRFSIRLYGAPSLLSGGDVNDGQQGMSDYWSRLADMAGYSVTGAFGPARFGLEFGGDIVFQISPNLGIGLGAGYINAARESSIEFRQGSETLPETVKPAYGSVPIRLGLFYTIPVSSKMSVVLSGGPELHLARASTLWTLTEGSDTIRQENTVKGTGLGFQAAAAFEFRLSPSIGLLLEIAGRYAKFGGLTGTFSSSDNSNSFETTGTFYAVEIPGVGSERFLVVMVSEATPTGYLSVREAKLDLTGGSLRFGLVIHI